MGPGGRGGPGGPGGPGEPGGPGGPWWARVGRTIVKTDSSEAFAVWRKNRRFCRIRVEISNYLL